MRKFDIYIFLLLSFLVSVMPVYSQTAGNGIDTVSQLSGISIETSVDKADIYIGDLITYKITIVYDSAYELIPPPLGANLGSFDVKDYDSDNITKLDDGKMQSVSTFILSTFTTGDYVIPPIPVLFNLPDGSRKALLSESIPIAVNSLLGTDADTTDVRPNKAQHEFIRDMTPYYIWGGSGLVLLAVLLLILLKWLRRKKEIEEPVDNRPPWEIAFEKLAFLNQKDLLSQNLFKLYYLELTEILREYYGKIFILNVLDMTTEEFLTSFKDKKLPENIFHNTRTLLTHADLVKFAKLIPQNERVGDDFKLVHDMIETVREDYERRKQLEVSLKKNNYPPDSNRDEVSAQ